MKRVVLRVRPMQVMEDLDLDLIQARAARLKDWRARVHDTRLSDAPYVSIVVGLPDIHAAALARLKEAFAELPRMRISLWRGIGSEVPLAAAEMGDLEQGARALEGGREGDPIGI